MPRRRRRRSRRGINPPAPQFVRAWAERTAGSPDAVGQAITAAWAHQLPALLPTQEPDAPARRKTQRQRKRPPPAALNAASQALDQINALRLAAAEVFVVDYAATRAQKVRDLDVACARALHGWGSQQPSPELTKAQTLLIGALEALVSVNRYSEFKMVKIDGVETRVDYALPPELTKLHALKLPGPLARLRTLMVKPPWSEWFQGRIRKCMYLFNPKTGKPSKKACLRFFLDTSSRGATEPARACPIKGHKVRVSNYLKE